MQDYPHRYKAAAQGGIEGIIDTSSPGLQNIAAMPPPEFDGPGDKWSPETARREVRLELCDLRGYRHSGPGGPRDSVH